MRYRNSVQIDNKKIRGAGQWILEYVDEDSSESKFKTGGVLDYLTDMYIHMLVEIVDKTKVQVSTYYFSVLQAQEASFFQYN